MMPMKIGRKFVFALNAFSFILLNRYRYLRKLRVNIKFFNNIYGVLRTFYDVGNSEKIFDLNVWKIVILAIHYQNFTLKVLVKYSIILRVATISCMFSLLFL